MVRALCVIPISVFILAFHIAPVRNHRAPVTDADKKAIVQAIEDEIYDEGCQGEGWDAAARHDDTSAYEQRVYIEPDLDVDQGSNSDERSGYVIYKLMPIGEVYRLYWFEKGLVVLGGHPEWDFPPTEPSYKSVYMDDDDLCHFKRDWLRTTFTITLKPTRERVQEAAARQKQRLGEKYVAHQRDCSFGWR